MVDIVLAAFSYFRSEIWIGVQRLIERANAKAMWLDHVVRCCGTRLVHSFDNVVLEGVWFLKKGDRAIPDEGPMRQIEAQGCWQVLTAYRQNAHGRAAWHRYCGVSSPRPKGNGRTRTLHLHTGKQALLSYSTEEVNRGGV
jgi:hypothetical protein